MRNCAFCRIASGEESARVVYQDEDVTAFHDRNPQAPTHVLIIPNEHIESVDEITSEDVDLLGRLFVVARQVAEEEEIGRAHV